MTFGLMTFSMLESTLPLWPMLAAVAVGLALATGLMRRQAHLFVVAGVALAAVLALRVFFLVPSHLDHDPRATPNSSSTDPAVVKGEMSGQEDGHGGVSGPRSETYTVFRWISLGNDQWIDVNYFLDSLTGVMLVTVTFVGLMVVIYAIGYMRDHHGHSERGYERFFAFLALFVFSMAMLVLAGNFVLLYLGWELVGMCSYLLIGFYYGKPEAAAAAKKAFLVNRIGDFGFALGIFALYLFINPHVRPGENPLDYAVVFRYVAEGALSGGKATLVALLLLCGALGKSAQFPLYMWLPDAMEGPTPVSALIHAATMVTAGVYMVARCGPIFAQSEVALNVVAAVGAATAMFTATMAMAQYDMKRILAYSTISQLAFMFVGLGCGAPDSAVFHLHTHAFFKALLFLTAGSVMHAMGGVIDVRQFSGLRSILPTTYRLMFIGCLALAGFPLLSGFWSKDEIVHAAFEKNALLGLIMLATAFMTAYYTFRMFFLAFGGPVRLPKEAGAQPHDSPAVMQNPLRVLAVGAVFAGYFGVSLAVVNPSDNFLTILAPHGFVHEYLASSTMVRTAHHGGGAWLMYLSSAVAIAGITLAWLRYGDAPRRDPDADRFGSLWNLWHAKYYVDELCERCLVQPLRRTADALFSVDRGGVDGAVWVLSAIPRGLGAALRLLQNGSLQGYGLGMAAGLAALMIWWMLASSGIGAGSEFAGVVRP